MIYFFNKIEANDRDTLLAIRFLRVSVFEFFRLVFACSGKMFYLSHKNCFRLIDRMIDMLLFVHVYSFALFLFRENK